MFGVNGWEFILLALIAVFVLGPDRLPEYAAKLAHAIKKLRVLAEGAREQLRDQLGPEYEDIDWRQYDPRQYDPRRIVREALLDPLDEAVAPVRQEIGSVRSAARLRGDAAAGAAGAAAAGAAASGSDDDLDTDDPDLTDLPEPAENLGSLRPGPRRSGFDPDRPTPWDAEAT